MDRTIVGKVVSAEWNQEEQGIDLVLQFEPTGAKLRGTCRAGRDPQTGHSLSATKLKANLSKVRQMKVYWSATTADGRPFDPSRLSKLTIQLDLSKSDLSVAEVPAGPDANTFLSRILR